MKTNKKFKCKNTDCIKYYKENEDDNRLILKIEDNTYVEYLISDDGTLEYHDSDGNGQEFHMYCHLCGHKYNFNYRDFDILEQHVLPLTKEELNDIECVNEYE
jgi:hypothetical protein